MKKKDFEILTNSAMVNFAETFRGISVDLDLQIELLKMSKEEFNESLRRGNKDKIRKKRIVYATCFDACMILIQELCEDNQKKEVENNGTIKNGNENAN